MIEFAGLNHEKDSSVLKENKKICENWNEIILEKGGTANAKYTAWALILEGKFNSKYDWNIKLRKSTSTSSHLLLSTNKLLFKQTIIEVNGIETIDSDFLIRKRNWKDPFRKLLFKNFHRFENNPKYVIDKMNLENLDSLLTKFIRNSTSHGDLESLNFSSKSKRLIISLRTLFSDKKRINSILNIVS